MILLLRIISDEDPDFFRDLVIEGSDTFLDFHRCLQKNLEYDETQLASFFITDEMWAKQKEITLIDMMQDPAVDTLTMGEVTLEEYVRDEGQRIIYVFDFFSERAFFIELIETTREGSPKETPFVANARGDAPRQLALDMISDDLPDGDELMNELDDDLNLDDPDMESLDSLNPDEY